MVNDRFGTITEDLRTIALGALRLSPPHTKASVSAVAPATAAKGVLKGGHNLRSLLPVASSAAAAEIAADGAPPTSATRKLTQPGLSPPLTAFHTAILRVGDKLIDILYDGCPDRMAAARASQTRRRVSLCAGHTDYTMDLFPDSQLIDAGMLAQLLHFARWVHVELGIGSANTSHMLDSVSGLLNRTRMQLVPVKADINGSGVMVHIGDIIRNSEYWCGAVCNKGH